MIIRKALIPCAGLGTRLLPATKVVPKELFPILNRPAVEYIVDELLASGIQEIVFVIHPTKQAIMNHFFPGGFVENSLKAKGTLSKYEALSRYHGKVRFRVAYQHEAKGLGHAVLCGKDEIENEPFIVVLPDDIIYSQTPASLQLIQKAKETGKYAIAALPVEPSETKSYGILGGAWSKDQSYYECSTLVEKPESSVAPSNLAVIGRYVLPSTIFSLLENIKPGALGEIQLTDALNILASQGNVIGVPFEGRRIDMGQPQGFVEANLVYGLADSQSQKHILKVIEQLGKVC